MRKPIIAGNWKMNNTINSAVKLVSALTPLVKGVKDVDIVICPPATSLAVLCSTFKGKNIQFGAQNVHWEESGAYTGEISASMITELGAKYVIIGHSERREFFGETDEYVNKRTKAALAAGLTPIICVGESLATREKGTYLRHIARQVKLALEDLSGDKIGKCVIAYEPIWAIGTGKTADAAVAEEVCAHIRKTVEKIAGEKAAKKVRIQYGGSVNPSTIKGFMAESDIDGALVGGASLKAADFAAIVKY